MNFSSPRLQALLQTIGKPPSIAALISVGFHGVLFALGASVSSLSVEALGSSDGVTDTREVPLIELSPEEQAKLPAFTRPGAVEPDLSDLGDGDLGSFGQLFPSSPAPSNSGQSDSLADMPGGLSSPLQIFSPPPFRSPLLPPISRRPSTTTRIPTPTAPSAVTPARPRTTSSPSPAATPPEASTPGAATAPNDGYEGPTAADLLPPSATEDSANEDSAPLIAAGEAGEGGSAEVDPAVAALLAQQRATTYQAEKTSDEAAAAARQSWLGDLPTEAGEAVEVAEVIDLPLVYERRICLDPEPSNAQVGLWLAPDAASQPPLELIKSSGYPFINQNALELVAQAVSGEDGANLPPGTAYLFNIEVSAAESGCVAPEEFLKQLSEPLPEPDREGGSESSTPIATPSPKPDSAAE